MNINPGKTEFTEAEHEAIVLEVRGKISPSLPQAEVARQADVAEATLSQYLNRKYTSEPGKTQVAAKLHKWLRARELDAAMRRQLPTPPSYLKLRLSESITSALHYARETGRLVQITGVPGVSKTATARQFSEDFPRTWYAAMDPTTGGVPTMLLAVLEAMGEKDAKGTPQNLQRRVCNLAQEAKGLLIIDEAQHLSEQAIDAVRAINDRVRIGIAMLGNEAAHTRIGPTGTKPAFAQVSSRVAQRRFIVAPDPRDAASLAMAWAQANNEEITTAEVDFCKTIAAKPGGLRNIEMTMEGAILAARGAEEPLSLSHLQGAFAQLSGVAHGFR